MKAPKPKVYKLNKQQGKLLKSAGFAAYKGNGGLAQTVWKRGPLFITLFSKSVVTLKDLVKFVASEAAFQQRKLVGVKIKELEVD